MLDGWPPPVAVSVAGCWHAGMLASERWLPGSIYLYVGYAGYGSPTCRDGGDLRLCLECIMQDRISIERGKKYNVRMEITDVHACLLSSAPVQLPPTARTVQVLFDSTRAIRLHRDGQAMSARYACWCAVLLGS